MINFPESRYGDDKYEGDKLRNWMQIVNCVGIYTIISKDYASTKLSEWKSKELGFKWILNKFFKEFLIFHYSQHLKYYVAHRDIFNWVFYEKKIKEYYRLIDVYFFIFF